MLFAGYIRGAAAAKGSDPKKIIGSKVIRNQYLSDIPYRAKRYEPEEAAPPLRREYVRTLPIRQDQGACQNTTI